MPIWFKAYGHHPNLHVRALSSPTRRSSGLIADNLRPARRQAALPPCDRYRTSFPLCHCAFPAPHRAASYATPPFRANGARRWHEPGAACVLSVTPLPRPGRSPARPPRETPMQRHALASALLCILALSACSTVGDEQVSSQPATRSEEHTSELQSLMRL